jgi:hypothetical protein
MLQRGLWMRNWLISIKLSTPHSSLTTYRMTSDVARSLFPWLLILLLVAGFQDSDPGADVWQCLLQTGNQLFPLYGKIPTHYSQLCGLRIRVRIWFRVPMDLRSVEFQIRICIYHADSDPGAQITL